MFIKYTKDFNQEDLSGEELYDELTRLRNLEFELKQYKENGDENYLNYTLKKL